MTRKIHLLKVLFQHWYLSQHVFSILGKYSVLCLMCLHCQESDVDMSPLHGPEADDFFIKGPSPGEFAGKLR